MSYKKEFEDLEKKLYCQDDQSLITNTYLSIRYEQTVKWYIREACRYKKGYLALSIASIIFPAVIPVINCFSYSWITIAVTVISVITSVVTSLLSLLKLHEKWISYREVAEALQSELTLYAENCGEYGKAKSEQEKNQYFAERIESLMGDEHIKWQNIVSKKENNPSP